MTKISNTKVRQITLFLIQSKHLRKYYKVTHSNIFFKSKYVFLQVKNKLCKKVT